MARRASGAIANLCLLAATPVAADELPLWEVGAGIGAFALPDYRGSEQGRAYLLPVPYLVYRGKFLKADRKGVRGAAFDASPLLKRDTYVAGGVGIAWLLGESEQRVEAPE